MKINTETTQKISQEYREEQRWCKAYLKYDVLA